MKLNRLLVLHHACWQQSASTGYLAHLYFDKMLKLCKVVGIAVVPKWHVFRLVQTVQWRLVLLQYSKSCN